MSLNYITYAYIEIYITTTKADSATLFVVAIMLLNILIEGTVSSQPEQYVTEYLKQSLDDKNVYVSGECSVVSHESVSK